MLLHDPKSHERKPKARFKEVGAEKLRREYVPVLVEATLALHVDVLGPDGLQGTEATRSLNVANHTDADHWGSFDDGHSLNDLAGTSLRTRTFDLTDNVGHTSFEAQEGRQVAGLLSIVLREGLHLTAMTLGTLLGIESHGAMTRRRKFSVRLE